MMQVKEITIQYPYCFSFETVEVKSGILEGKREGSYIISGRWQQDDTGNISHSCCWQNLSNHKSGLVKRGFVHQVTSLSDIVD